MARQRIFSITSADLEWENFRGSGPGGQKRNKTSNAARCRHEPSGAIGESKDGRSLHQNKQKAFLHMTETPEFKTWMALQLEIARGNIRYEEADANGIFHEVKLEPGK